MTSPSERRSVAVLFVALADAERAAEARERLGAARAAAERFGGTAETLPDGSLMAVFGAPVAHADDPLRAVRAGLELRAMGGAFRGGIHAGEVLWGSVAGEKPTAIGDVVNVARRLSQAADAGQLLVSKAVERAVPRKFRFRELPALQLKGREEAVLPYEALTEHAGQTEFGRPQAPIVGRDAELARLLMGGFVVVEGAPGVGKSRLLAEYRTRLRARRPDAWVATGRVPEGLGLPLAPFAEIVRAEAGASGMDRGDAARIVEALRVPLEAAGRSRLESENFAHLAALSIGVPLPDARVRGLADAQLETRRAWAAWLEAKGGVVCIEDLHEADSETIALLEYVAAARGDRPSRASEASRGIVATCRPGGPIPRGFSRVTLEDLPREAALALARRAMGREIAPRTERFLLDSTGGNPLYIEELARYLREEGLLDAIADGAGAKAGARLERIPTSLHGVLVARLDALPADVKEVVKAASVVGRTFWHLFLSRLLAREVEDDLAEAGSRDMVHAQEGSLLEGDGQYIFRHALLRDAAYSLVPKKDRVRLHGLTAELLEKRAVHGGRQVKALAAAHHREAGRHDDAARLWCEAALEASRDAAWTEELAWARASFALRPSVATRLLAARALERLARNEEALAEVEAAVAESGTADERVEALLVASRAFHSGADYDRAIAWADRALAAGPSPRWEAAARTARAHGLHNCSRWTEALAEVDAGLRALEAAPDAPVHVGGALHEARGLVLTRLRRHDEARASLEKTLALARQSGQRVGIASALNNLAGVLRETGRYEDALALHQETLRLVEEAGDRRLIATSLNNIGNTLRHLQRFDEALDLARQGLAVRRDMADSVGIAASLHTLGAILNDQKRRAEALPLLRESLAIRRSIGDQRASALLLLGLGVVEHDLKDPEALPHLEEAVALSRAVKDATTLGKSLLALGREMRRQGREGWKAPMEEAFGFMEGLVPEEELEKERTFYRGGS